MRSKELPICENCTCISTPFQYLNPDELAYINRNRVEISFRKGERLCKQGTFATHVLYLRSGLIKIISEESRVNLVLSIETSGYFLGLQVLFKPHKFTYSAVASEDTVACLLDINAFSDLTQKNARFAAGMMKRINDDLKRSYERIATLGVKQLHGRLSDLMLCLSVRIYKSSKFTTSLSRKDMAEITNMSPESLSRVLKDMKEEKLLKLKGNRFEILNIEALRRWSKVG
jgi:CRP/FNR family transcriptional regulator